VVRPVSAFGSTDDGKVWYMDVERFTPGLSEHELVFVDGRSCTKNHVGPFRPRRPMSTRLGRSPRHDLHAMPPLFEIAKEVSRKLSRTVGGTSLKTRLTGMGAFWGRGGAETKLQHGEDGMRRFSSMCSLMDPDGTPRCATSIGH